MKHRTKSLRILLTFLIYGMSQTPPTASELSEEPQSNIFKQIILDDYMDDPAKELWNLRLVSWEFYGFVGEKFKTLNIKKKHLQWVDYPLSEPMLYVCNTRLMIVLSYIYNQSINQASKNVDHPIFMQNSKRLLDQKHLPNAPFGFYVAHFSQEPANEGNFLDEIIRKMPQANFVEEGKPQNENHNFVVLCQHFLWTWQDAILDEDTPHLPIDPVHFIPYQNLRGSFARLLNPQLLEAKRKLPISVNEYRENLWSEILTLDPSPTYCQLDRAGRLAYRNGSYALAADWLERSLSMPSGHLDLKHIIPRIKKIAKSYQEIGRYRRSAYYWNQYISFINKGARTRHINVDDYRESASANHYAENFGQAATYWSIYLKLLRTTNQEIPADDYRSAAMSFYNASDYRKAGRCFTQYLKILDAQNLKPSWQILHDVAVSFHNFNSFREASNYFGQMIKTKLKEGVKPSSDDYKYAAVAHAASNRFKSAAYFTEQHLKSLGPEDAKPEPSMYEKISNYHLYGSNFVKAAQFFDLFLESLQQKSEEIAISYLYRGAYLNLRALNFERASELFRMELSALIEGDYEIQVPMLHNTILIDLCLERPENIQKSLKLFVSAYQKNADAVKLASLRRILAEKERADELDFLEHALKPKSKKKMRLKKF